MESTFPFQPAENTSSASWLTKRLKGSLDHVTSVVPEGFDAYVRIYHPARLHTDGSRTSLSWKDVAQASGRATHREMQWYGIANGHPLLDSQGQPLAYEEDRAISTDRLELPAMGTLPPELITPLRRILANHTSSNKYYFAVWEGFGLADMARSAPVFEIPARKFHLFHAPLEAIETSFSASPFDDAVFHQTANLWWPDDQVWCVSTEIDFMSTYVGATEETIAEIIKSSVFEAECVEPTDKVCIDAVNAQ